jgi:hypothetical protein
MAAYFASGDALMVTLANGEADRVGTILSDPDTALRLLNRAAHEQDRRHYTASARLYVEADTLVAWDDGGEDD